MESFEFCEEIENMGVWSKGLRCNSLWGFRIFSLYQACDKTKNMFLLLVFNVFYM